MPRNLSKHKMMPGAPDFTALVEAIAQINARTQATAAKAVNMALTCRNWLIGAYIHEYELKGRDRAEYATNLFEKLAERLNALGIPNCNRSRLYRYRDFYRLYPQIREAFPSYYQDLLPAELSRSGGNVATVSPQSRADLVATMSPLSADIILGRLSYSHIELDKPLFEADVERIPEE